MVTLSLMMDIGGEVLSIYNLDTSKSFYKESFELWDNVDGNYFHHH